MPLAVAERRPFISHRFPLPLAEARRYILGKLECEPGQIAMMQVQQIDHINIDTKDLAATCAFYEKVLDLKPGPTPDTGRPLQWMYAGDRPLFHIGQPREDEDVADGPPGGYGFAHIALHIADYDAARRRLEDNNIEYRTNELSRPRVVRQLFFEAPDGVEIELIEVGEFVE